MVKIHQLTMVCFSFSIRLIGNIYSDLTNEGCSVADKLCSSENSSIQNASFVTEESDHSKGGQNSFSMSDEKIVIGIEDETKEFSDRLIGGCKQLEVIFVTGMAGIGRQLWLINYIMI